MEEQLFYLTICNTMIRARVKFGLTCRVYHPTACFSLGESLTQYRKDGLTSFATEQRTPTDGDPTQNHFTLLLRDVQTLQRQL